MTKLPVLQLAVSGMLSVALLQEGQFASAWSAGERLRSAHPLFLRLWLFRDIEEMFFLLVNICKMIHLPHECLESNCDAFD